MKKNATKLATEFRKFLLCIHLIKEFGILIPCPAFYTHSESEVDFSHQTKISEVLYIWDISILGRLGLYPYPTISVGEAHCPSSHVPLYIQP